MMKDWSCGVKGSVLLVVKGSSVELTLVPGAALLRVDSQSMKLHVPLRLCPTSIELEKVL